MLALKVLNSLYGNEAVTNKSHLNVYNELIISID